MPSHLNIIKIHSNNLDQYIHLVNNDKRQRILELIPQRLIIAISYSAAHYLKKTQQQIINNYNTMNNEYTYKSINLDCDFVVPNIITPYYTQDAKRRNKLHYNAIENHKKEAPYCIIALSNGNIIRKQHFLIVDENNNKVARDTLIKTIPQSIINNKIFNIYRTRYNISRIEPTNIFEIDLSPIEEAIITGLLANFTMNEIASSQQVSRDYIKKIIVEKLCVKFNITGGSSKLLVDKLVSLSYYYYIPQKILFEPSKTPALILNSNELHNREILISNMLTNYFTQQEIADCLGISRSYVAKIIATKIPNSRY